ncbi:DUF6248 family natural product biosynthesis protein [Streptomyces sp. NPDC054841]
MTTWLRLVGASIMGILDPVPSTTASPMTEEEGAWVRANAWTKGLRKIDDAYPRGFHRWCSCERDICHPCGSGHHAQCASANGPRVNKNSGTITDRGGFVVAVIQYGPGERPCRWICPCTHTADAEQTTADDAPTAPPADRRTPPAPKPAATPAWQFSLFSDADLPEESSDGEAR